MFHTHGQNINFFIFTRVELVKHTVDGSYKPYGVQVNESWSGADSQARNRFRITKRRSRSILHFV